jgi:hypothetical protein
MGVDLTLNLFFYLPLRMPSERTPMRQQEVRIQAPLLRPER